MSSDSSFDEPKQEFINSREPSEAGGSYREESDPANTGPAFSDGICVKYGSQQRLLAVEMGIFSTESRAFCRHPEEVEPKPLEYADAIEKYTRVTEDKPPLFPLLLFGQVQIAYNSHQVHVLPEAMHPVLDELVELMQTYEQRDAEPLSCFDNGMPCVAKHQGVWCRAKVVSPPEVTDEGTLVEIMYVDWGNWEKVATDRVFPLMEDFGLLPPLAIRCRIIRELPDPTDPAEVAKMESDLQDVLEEIDYKVKVELLNVDDAGGTTPLNAQIYVHPCAESPLADSLARELLKQKPSDPSKVNEETIALARGRLAENIKTVEKMRLIADEADNFEEEDLDKILFPDIRERTEEEWREYMIEKMNDDEADFRAKRNRQRSGPSRKVQVARRELAVHQSLDVDSDTDVDFDRVPGQENAYFTRKRPAFVSGLQHRIARPWAANGIWIEYVVTHVDNARQIYMQTARNIRSLKKCEERLWSLYGPNPSEGAVGPMKKTYIRPGTPCVVFEEKQQRYVRAIVDSAEEDEMIELLSLDRGYQLPSIDWSDRAKLRPLRAVTECEGQPMVHRFELRLACQHKPDQLDEQIFKRLMPEGSVWLVAVEDRKIPPPFRVDIRNLWTGENLLQVYADERQMATGRRPFWKEYNYIPLGAARNKAKRQKRYKRTLELLKEEMTPKSVPHPPVPPDSSSVIVTYIGGPQNIVVQTEKQANEVIEFGIKMTDFYKHRTGSSPKPIICLSGSRLRRGSPCVCQWPFDSPDFHYYRGKIVEIHPKDNEPQEVRVLFTDYGNVSDWIKKHCVYPLDLEYRTQPAFAYNCFLDGFQKDKMNEEKTKQLQMQMLGSIHIQPPQYYTANFMGKEKVLGKEKYCIRLIDNYGQHLVLKK